jgi:nucleoside-triphosphatase
LRLEDQAASETQGAVCNECRPQPAVQVYLVDEIGKIECLSKRFVAVMRSLLIGPKPVVATIALRGGGFITEAKRTQGAVIWEVTRANRDLLPSRGLRWLGAEV